MSDSGPDKRCVTQSLTLGWLLEPDWKIFKKPNPTPFQTQRPVVLGKSLTEPLNSPLCLPLINAIIFLLRERTN